MHAKHIMRIMCCMQSHHEQDHINGDARRICDQAARAHPRASSEARSESSIWWCDIVGDTVRGNHGAGPTWWWGSDFGPAMLWQSLLPSDGAASLCFLQQGYLAPWTPRFLCLWLVFLPLPALPRLSASIFFACKYLGELLSIFSWACRCKEVCPQASKHPFGSSPSRCQSWSPTVQPGDVHRWKFWWPPGVQWETAQQHRGIHERVGIVEHSCRIFSCQQQRGGQDPRESRAVSGVVLAHTILPLVKMEAAQDWQLWCVQQLRRVCADHLSPPAPSTRSRWGPMCQFEEIHGRGW